MILTIICKGSQSPDDPHNHLHWITIDDLRCHLMTCEGSQSIILTVVWKGSQSMILAVIGKKYICILFFLFDCCCTLQLQHKLKIYENNHPPANAECLRLNVVQASIVVEASLFTTQMM